MPRFKVEVEGQCPSSGLRVSTHGRDEGQGVVVGLHHRCVAPRTCKMLLWDDQVQSMRKAGKSWTVEFFGSFGRV